MDLNQRLQAMHRGGWSGIEDAGRTEQFTLSTSLGEALDVPDGCTGITVAHHLASQGGIFVYMAGGVVGQPSSNDSGTTLTDSSATFITDGVSVGDRVRNLTDGSVGVVTGVTSETVLAIAGDLSGGDENDWDRFVDWYRVETIDGPRVLIEGAQQGQAYYYFPIGPIHHSVASPASAAEARNIYLIGENADEVDVYYHFD